MHATDFLDAAKRHQSERGQTYEYSTGSGERSATRVAIAFNAITGRLGTEQIKGSDVLLILQCLKDVRQYSAPGFHQDSAEDKVSYGALHAELLAHEYALELAPRLAEFDSNGRCPDCGEFMSHALECPEFGVIAIDGLTAGADTSEPLTLEPGCVLCGKHHCDRFHEPTELNAQTLAALQKVDKHQGQGLEGAPNGLEA